MTCPKIFSAAGADRHLPAGVQSEERERNDSFRDDSSVSDEDFYPVKISF